MAKKRPANANSSNGGDEGPEEYLVEVRFQDGGVSSYLVVGRDMALPGWIVLYEKDDNIESGVRAKYINNDTVIQVVAPVFMSRGE